jgi:transcriptional regulator with XRE-family HTH domain
MFAKNLPVVFSSTELTSEPGRVAEGAIAMPLDALRDARQLTQVQMAQLLKISQGAVSKVERRTDMFVSTLRNYVRAIGGDLEIRAVFPEGDVLIDQFARSGAVIPARRAGETSASPPPASCPRQRRTPALSNLRWVVPQASVHHVGTGRILAGREHV